MTSWGPGFAKPKGIQNLSYYHQSGFQSYAQEFFDLCVSVTYAQDTKNFLFVFDMINSVGAEFLLFQHTLKKNPFIRYLPYYPTTGYNIKDRTDLTHPIALRGAIPDKDDLFKIAPQLFHLQEKIREKNNVFFQKHELHAQDYAAVVCVSPTQEDPQVYVQAMQFLPRTERSIYIVCSSLEVFERFCREFPSCWQLFSIHMTRELHTQTQEQKINRMYLEIGELERMRSAPDLIGTFDDVRCRLAGLLEKRYREANSSFHSIDGKFFSIFPSS